MQPTYFKTRNAEWLMGTSFGLICLVLVMTISTLVAAMKNKASTAFGLLVFTLVLVFTLIVMSSLFQSQLVTNPYVASNATNNLAAQIRQNAMKKTPPPHTLHHRRPLKQSRLLK